LILIPTGGHKVLANARSGFKEFIPSVLYGRNDPIVSPDPHGNLFDVIGQARICWQPDRLGSIVRKNSGDELGLSV
jgi:hypothetical protein